LKWGIIGCGDVVKTKSGGAFKDVGYVLSRNGAEEYAASIGAKATSTPEELIENVDAVYIATPPDGHNEYVRLFALYGKPILVEKPMARTALEASIMASDCQERNTPLFVAYYRRCLPRFRKIKEIIESGAIGKIRFAHIQHTLRPEDHPVAPVLKDRPIPWRYSKAVNGGGNFVDMGTHHLDLLDWFFGPVTVLHGEASNQGGLYETEDTVFASMKAGDVNVTGQWCYAAGVNEDSFHVVGGAGSIEFRVFNDWRVKVVTREGNKENTEFLTIQNPKWVHQPLVQAVEEEINSGSKCPTNWENGLRAMRVQDRILNASRNP